VKIRVLAYLALLLLNLYLLNIQVQLYQSPTEIVTAPQLGYFNMPKDHLLIILIGSVLMLPYIIAQVIGAMAEAEWLLPIRLFAAVTAFIEIVVRFLFITSFSFWSPIGEEFVSFFEITLVYLLVEGTVTLWEGFHSV